ncbi:hypothetical protein Tco_1262208 [Tanacetum coccineum]
MPRPVLQEAELELRFILLTFNALTMTLFMLITFDTETAGRTTAFSRHFVKKGLPPAAEFNEGLIIRILGIIECIELMQFVKTHDSEHLPNKNILESATRTRFHQIFVLNLVNFLSSSPICSFRGGEVRMWLNEFRDRIIPCKNRSRVVLFQAKSRALPRGDNGRKHKLYRRTPAGRSSRSFISEAALMK